MVLSIVDNSYCPQSNRRFLASQVQFLSIISLILPYLTSDYYQICIYSDTIGAGLAFKAIVQLT